MKQIALSTDQMKYLESLGLDTSDASIVINDNEQEGINGCNNGFNEGIPAYTLQDILEKLPTHKTFSEKYNDSFGRYYVRLVSTDDDDICTILSNNSLLEAAFQMLIWCIENNYIKTDKI